MGAEERFAAEEFMESKRRAAEEERDMLENMRELLFDVLYSLEKESGEKFVNNIRMRVEAARSISELRMVMDGLMVLGEFVIGRVGVS